MAPTETPTVDEQTDPNAPGTPFTVLLRVEGLETSDGRMFELGGTSWRDLPWPLMVQDTAPHGPGQQPAPAWAAGQVEEVYRDPEDATRIMGRGHLMPNEVGARAEDIARHAFRGVSTDSYGTTPFSTMQQPTIVDQDGEPLAVLTRYDDDVISRVTMVPTPALEACCLWFDDEAMPQVAADAHGGIIPTNTPPEVVNLPSDPYEQLVASGGGPAVPPRDWFFTPEPDHYEPVSVTADGRLTGHLARKGQCHVGYLGKCETAPMSVTVPPFKGFHRTIARCDDGSEVACGWIAMDTDHGDPVMRARWSNGETWDHYEHSGVLAAKVRASNGKHGIWLSGALLPGLTDRQCAIAQGLSVSGHWHVFNDPESGRRYGDELLAVLGGVSMPGFPETRTRPELLVASGKIEGRIGLLEPCDCEESEEPMTPEERAEFDALKTQVDGLVASATAQAVISDEEGTDVDALVASMNAIEADADRSFVAQFARYSAKYNAGDRKKMASDGEAMPDGSFPIGDVDDLKDAIKAVGRSNTAHDSVRKHIMKRAKALESADLIPDGWNADGSLKTDD